MVDVCVVCIYTRSMHLPLNGEVYGVVRSIYTQRGIYVTCYCYGYPTTLIGGK